MATIPEALAVAVQFQQDGHLREAEQIYCQIVAADPNHAEAWQRLSSIYVALSRFDEATACDRRLCQAMANPSPDSPLLADNYNDQGLAFAQQDRLTEAAASFQQALQLDPVHAGAHNNLGLVRARQGRLDDAVVHYESALRCQPDFVEACYNLGNILRDLGRLDEAVKRYEQVERLKPDFAEVYNNHGIALVCQEKLKEAATLFRRALQLKPDYAKAQSNLGNVLRDLGLPNDALDCYDQALLLQPAFAEAHANRGVVLRDLGRFEDAVACYEQAIRLRPDYAKAHADLGAVLYDQGRLDEARTRFEQTLHLQPGNAEAHLDLGSVSYDQGRLDDAIAHYQHAIRIKPDFVDAHWNLAFQWLLAGNFERGWPEYEWRWHHKEFVSHNRAFPQPRWDGSNLAGRTILVHAEQGLGDTFQFIRYAPFVKQRGGRVVVVCQKEVAQLLAHCAGIDQIVVQYQPVPPFDVQAPLLSLPGIFRTTLATIPAEVPYLVADLVLTEQWRKRLNDFRGFKIGIAWQGNRIHKRDRQRSVPLRHFAPVAGLEGVRLFSLQKGPGTEQLAEVEDQFHVVDLSGQFTSFMDTAAVMMNLDLVITIDSVVAHCAGALGIPVWVALQFAPDWRWLLEREDCPWYPSMRLFRQQRRGEWEEVFDRLGREVERVRSEAE